MTTNTVASIVLDVMDIDEYELSDDQIKSLDEQLKLKSIPHQKVEFKLGLIEIGQVKLAPQAKILHSVLDDDSMSLETWGDKAAKAGMKTKQDPARIAAYYRKTLVEHNLAVEVQVN